MAVQTRLGIWTVFLASTVAASSLIFGSSTSSAQTDTSANAGVEVALRTISRADGTTSSDQAATAAAKQIQQLPSTRVTDVLGGFKDATKRGRNWLRAVAADVSDNGPFQSESLLDFFNNRSNDADARYVAYQLLTQHDRELAGVLLANAQTDPSLPVRYLKIEALIQQGKEAANDQPDLAKQLFREVISNGRSPNQLETAAKLLAEMDVNIDLADELGMMRRWWVIGPFDNTDSRHFDTAYVPENRYIESGDPIDRDASGQPRGEQGKDGTVQWQSIQSVDNLGMVDLNGPLAGEKDAAAYLFTKFTITKGDFVPAAQIRIGCITANKVWVNGKLVASNEVYHSGTRIDQYVEPCQLIDGENTILIKVMQNAQTEPWAQDWQFQFRLTRDDGAAIKTVAAQ